MKTTEVIADLQGALNFTGKCTAFGNCIPDIEFDAKMQINMKIDSSTLNLTRKCTVPNYSNPKSATPCKRIKFDAEMHRFRPQ